MKKAIAVIAVFVVTYLAYASYVKNYFDVTLEIPVTIALGDREAFLISRGQAVSYLRSADYDANQWGKHFRMTALQFCLANFHDDSPLVNYRIFEVADILLQRGADINSTSSQGLTALHDAVYNANTEVISYLLQRGADVEKGIHAPGQPMHGLTPLAYALFLQQMPEIKHDYQRVIDLFKSGVQ